MVTVVHRRDAFRAERILQERLFARPNVEVVWDHVVEEILGDDLPAPTVRAVRLKNVHTMPDVTRQVDGVFVAIGHDPASDLFVGQLDCKPNGYIKTVPGSTVTSVPGVFAAGDVADDIYRQAVTAAGLGCMAALEAEKWLTLEAVTKIAAGIDRVATARRGDEAFWTGTSCGFSTPPPRRARFTHAGESLGLSQSAVSRQVSALEQELQAPLFHRHARGLILTEQGEVLYRTAQEVMTKLDAVRRG